MSEETTAQPGGDAQEQQQPQEAQGAYIPPMTTEEALAQEAEALSAYNAARSGKTPSDEAGEAAAASSASTSEG